MISMTQFSKLNINYI